MYAIRSYYACQGSTFKFLVKDDINDDDSQDGGHQQHPGGTPGTLKLPAILDVVILRHLDLMFND